MIKYYSIEERLYKLTNKQVKELNKLFPYDVKTNDQIHSYRLEWIEKNGKYIATCQNLAY